MGDVLKKIEQQREQRSAAESRRRKRAFITAAVVLGSCFIYTFWLLLGFEWPDNPKISVVDVKDVGGESYDPGAEDVCGDPEQLPQVEFMSTSDQVAWTDQEIESVSCFLSYIYPQIVAVYGEPLDEGRTLLLDKGGEFLAYYPYEHRIDFAEGGAGSEVDMNDYDTRLSLTHEFIHSFHGTRVSRPLLEEAMTETVTAKLYPRKNSIIDWVMENYEYLRENPVFRQGDDEIHEVYRFLPMVELLKLEYDDARIYKKINTGIYSDITLNSNSSYPLVELLQETVHGRTIEGKTGEEFVEDLFLVKDLEGMFCYELCTFVTADSNSIHVYVIKDGVGSYEEQFPVGIKLYDFQDNLLLDKKNTTNDVNNSYNLVTYYDMADNFPEEKQRYKLVATVSDSAPGGYDDVTFEMEYCPAYEDGLSGVVRGENYGALRVTGEGVRVHTAVSKGCFYVPGLKQYRGELELTFTARDGSSYTRHVLKVVEDYAVVIETDEKTFLLGG